ncbi:VOC family protein [Paenibacillus sp. J5C_2022]|uniref:VOC family protein n=1 Tax=Paenibacillus sp. J5C2022 TaxID=2977129 RepID=UPI0021D21B70|nr:VOC family protein [Paenibacillus sp. J5C2022]MCU6709165.1 VOC family protein [Paenibacillus sp. J5C2022]
MSNVKGIAHIAIQAKHFEQAVAFYTEALEFQVAHTWSLPEFQLKKAAMLVSADRHTCIEVFDDEAQIAAQGSKAHSEEEMKHGALLHIAVAVDNVQEAYDRALKHGAANCIPPMHLKLGEPAWEVHNALVYSPNGEVIEFIASPIYPAQPANAFTE